jgi:pimeloyl-ACP methyl ester carboxylesterase
MSKTHLVLVPGLLCDHAVWETQSRDLGDIAEISVADHGLSDSLAQMADAILQKAPGRFAIAGHSMGGRVAFEVLRQAPERVAAVALLDTAAGPRRPGPTGEQEAAERYRLLDKARQQGMRSMGIDWSRRMVHPARLSDERLMGDILDMIERKTPDIFAAQIKALLERADARPVLAAIRCPALVLCGREDSWSVLATHEEMAKAISHSRLAVIEKCGHMSPMERPAEVTAALRDWLVPERHD